MPVDSKDLFSNMAKNSGLGLNSTVFQNPQQLVFLILIGWEKHRSQGIPTDSGCFTAQGASRLGRCRQVSRGVGPWRLCVAGGWSGSEKVGWMVGGFPWVSYFGFPMCCFCCVFVFFCFECLLFGKSECLIVWHVFMDLKLGASMGRRQVHHSEGKPVVISTLQQSNELWRKMGNSGGLWLKDNADVGRIPWAPR